MPDSQGLPVPAAMDEREAGLEARIRHKLGVGEPLTLEERAFFGRMPADKGVSPAAVRAAYPDVH